MWGKMKAEGNSFFKELYIFMFLTLVTGSLAMLVFFQDLKLFMAFLSGALLACLNFLTLRKEGGELITRVYQNVMGCVERPYQKERTLFLIKVYLRLLAIGIIFYFFITKLGLHPVFLLLGFSLIYLQIFVVTVRFWLRKKESF